MSVEVILGFGLVFLHVLHMYSFCTLITKGFGFVLYFVGVLLCIFVLFFVVCTHVVLHMYSVILVKRVSVLLLY